MSPVRVPPYSDRTDISTRTKYNKKKVASTSGNKDDIELRSLLQDLLVSLIHEELGTRHCGDGVHGHSQVGRLDERANTSRDQADIHCLLGQESESLERSLEVRGSCPLEETDGDREFCACHCVLAMRMRVGSSLLVLQGVVLRLYMFKVLKHGAGSNQCISTSDQLEVSGVQYIVAVRVFQSVPWYDRQNLSAKFQVGYYSATGST